MLLRRRGEVRTRGRDSIDRLKGGSGRILCDNDFYSRLKGRRGVEALEFRTRR